MYIPSYDFQIFDLPSFSPLEANEYNADTSFSANTPTWWMQRSLNLLAGLTQPNNPLPYLNNQFPIAVSPTTIQSATQEDATTIRDRAIKVRDQAQKVIDDLGGDTSKTGNKGYNPLDPYGSGKQAGETLKNSPVTNPFLGGKTLGQWFAALPTGSGIFLIAVIIIILLLLFGRR